MFVIGNEELKGPLGSTTKCPNCHKEHSVRYFNKVLPDGTQEPSRMLAYVKCKKQQYLVGIDGRAI